MSEEPPIPPPFFIDEGDDDEIQDIVAETQSIQDLIDAQNPPVIVPPQTQEQKETDELIRILEEVEIDIPEQLERPHTAMIINGVLTSVPLERKTVERKIVPPRLRRSRPVFSDLSRQLQEPIPRQPARLPLQTVRSCRRPVSRLPSVQFEQQLGAEEQRDPNPSMGSLLFSGVTFGQQLEEFKTRLERLEERDIPAAQEIENREAKEQKRPPRILILDDLRNELETLIDIVKENLQITRIDAKHVERRADQKNEIEKDQKTRRDTILDIVALRRPQTDPDKYALDHNMHPRVARGLKNMPPGLFTLLQRVDNAISNTDREIQLLPIEGIDAREQDMINEARASVVQRRRQFQEIFNLGLVNGLTEAEFRQAILHAEGGGEFITVGEMLDFFERQRQGGGQRVVEREAAIGGQDEEDFETERIILLDTVVERVADITEEEREMLNNFMIRQRQILSIEDALETLDIFRRQNQPPPPPPPQSEL